MCGRARPTHTQARRTGDRHTHTHTRRTLEVSPCLRHPEEEKKKIQQNFFPNDSVTGIVNVRGGVGCGGLSRESGGRLGTHTPGAGGVHGDTDAARARARAQPCKPRWWSKRKHTAG